MAEVKWALVKPNAKGPYGLPHPLAGREVQVVGETFWGGRPVPLLETGDKLKWWAYPDDIVVTETPTVSHSA